MTAYSAKPTRTGDAPECIGVLLANLGTPDAPTPRALRRYLAEFFADPRVFEFPRLTWWLLANLIILNVRPGRSARLYQSIWTPAGSPMLVIARRQRQALQRVLEERLPGPVQVHVALGMRYGNPSIPATLEALRQAGASRILVLPMYPQYSAATTASTFDAVAAALKTWRLVPEVRFVNCYFAHPAYIAALANRIQAAWSENGESERLVFSFHGLPQRYVDAGDPYHGQCQRTARLVVEQLRLPPERWIVAFQSRFGPGAWLQPAIDETLETLAEDGVQSVDVVCPGFAADCLETLEEIDSENREIFLGAGGKTFHYIPALNDCPEHIDLLAQLVIEHTRGWPGTES